MTEPMYVISEEQLDAFEHLMGFKSEMRSRPLSQELTEAYREGYGDGRDATITELGEVEFVAKKAERERVLKDLCNLFRLTNNAGNFRPWNIGHIEQVIRKYRESLRSES